MFSGACDIFISISLKSLLSKLGITSTRSHQCTPSGFMTRVHSWVQEGLPELGSKSRLGQVLGTPWTAQQPWQWGIPQEATHYPPTGSERFLVIDMFACNIYQLVAIHMNTWQQICYILALWLWWSWHIPENSREVFIYSTDIYVMK